MSGVFVIARTYAIAILDVAIEQKNVNKWKSILNLFSDISKHNLIRSLLCRYLEPEKLSDIFFAIYEDYQKSHIDIFSRNLIRIMAENNRLLLLPIVLKEFNYLSAKYVRTIEIEVISACPLRTTQLKKITDIMTKRLSKTVNVVNNIDKHVLAGIIIRFGDTVIDGSVRGRIMRLDCMLQS